MDGSIHRSFSFAVALVASLVSVAQWRTAHWQVTGDQIDFTYNGVEITPSPSENNGRTASISDPEGELLFYTNGVAVFNANGDTIGDVSAPWGFGDPPFEQGWVLVPWPGDTQRVALFALVCFAAPVNCELHSYTLDRTLNDGAGGMVPGSDVLLMDSTTQQLTAVAHSNGEDYWAITHQRGTAVSRSTTTHRSA